MKTKTCFWFYAILVTSMFVILLNAGCEEDEDNNPSSTTVTDIDGNVYNTVTIGTQVWMKENLKTTKYRNGDAIPNISDATTWVNTSTGAYCDYENAQSNSTTYGKLYNWYAVNDSRKISPTGWHVATDAEWTTLENYLGGSTVAGGKMKTTTLWNSPNTGADNSSGFSALPAGYRYYFFFAVYVAVYRDLGNYGLWWSATENNTSTAWHRCVSYDNSTTYRGSPNKKNGLSVRCIKD